MSAIPVSLNTLSLVAIAMGGGLGSVMRYCVGVALARAGFISFPVGTLSVNVIGSFVMGLLTAYFLTKVSDASAFRLFLTVGLLGGFTTFSTFSLDALRLIERGDLLSAAGYVIASVVASLFALWLGLLLGRALG